ncbi:RICIN domain-containing protein, partial [Glycomyces sp. L485]
MKNSRLRVALAALLGAAVSAALSLVVTAPALALETGTWYLLQSRHSGLYMDIAGSSTSNGAM